jgi:hypothetical protein
MKMSPTQVKRYLYDTIINYFKFEGPDSFTHLGSVLGNGNMSKTQKGNLSTLITANRAHSAYDKLTSSKWCHEILN